MSNLIPVDQIRSMAISATNSKMFSAKAQDQIFMLMLVAQSEGMHPVKALMSYDIIQGQPALKASEALARYMDCGGKIEWIKSDEKSAKAKFTHSSSGTFEFEYTVEDATSAGLINKDNWKKNLKAMLRARCTSAGIRMSYPRCLNNFYTSDEVADFEPVEAPQEVIETAEIVDTEKDIKAMKVQLKIKLKKLNFSDADVQDFAKHYKLNDTIETLEKLVSDEKTLLEYVEKFENKEI